MNPMMEVYENNLIKFCARPFPPGEEMGEAQIVNKKLRGTKAVLDSRRK